MIKYRYHKHEKIEKRENGFTLVELLIVIGIFASITSLASTVLVTTFRTSSKTNIITTVKQNGDYIISNITNSIRYAKSVQCVSSSTVTATAIDGLQTTYDCSTGTITSSSGASSTPIPLYDTSSVTLTQNSCSFTCVQSSSSSYPLVQISFSLQTTNPGTLVEQTAPSEQFSTSVTLRNGTR